MALTVVMVLVFGAAIAVPAVWSIVGLVRGQRGSWPGLLGTGWGVLLLLVTLIGSALDWPGGSDASGAVVCRAGDAKNDSDCTPGVWLPERGQLSGCSLVRPAHLKSGAIPSTAYCPRGTAPVYSFCERFQVGGVKQPWATWSDLSFIAAGLWLLWLFQFYGRPGTTTSGATTISMTADNPMITLGALPVAYGLIVIFMGPPSQWYHASLKAWAAWFDTMSVVAWLTFNAVYVIYMLIGPLWGNGRGKVRTAVVLGVWAGVLVLFGAIAGASDSARLYLYFASGGAWGIAEVVYIFVAAFAKGVAYRRTWWLFLLNFGLLAVTMGIWVLFNDSILDPTTCRSREGFPGHALFHTLASFATVLTFFSFASERRATS
jgi:hypothetical protein